MGGTDWMPGIVALAVGAVLGLVLALRARKSAPRASAPEERDLDAGQEMLMARLRELSGAGDEASARERYRLELDAARTLLDLDRVAGEAAPRAAPSPERAPPTTGLAGWIHAHPKLQGAVWGVAATSAVFGLVLWVMSQAKDRAAGGSATGNAQAAMGAPAQAEDDPADSAELEKAQAFAKNHPDDVDAQLDLAEAYLQRDQPVPAYEAAAKVLKTQPDNPRALTYAGVVKSAMGQGDEAMKMLDRAVQLAPDLAEAWVHRGLVASEVGKYQVAVDSWEKALTLRPDGESLIRPALEKIKALAEQQKNGTGAFAAGMPANHPGSGSSAGPLPPGASDSGQLPPGHPAVGSGRPPMAGAMPTSAPSQGGGGGVRGTIELDPSLAGSVAPGTTLFLSARADGVTGGPPSAARRLTTGSFPMAFTLGPQDSMMGLPWPEKATIEARIDLDGNAMTRDPGAPVAVAHGVTPGAELKLVLQAP